MSLADTPKDFAARRVIGIDGATHEPRCAMLPPDFWQRLLDKMRPFVPPETPEVTVAQLIATALPPLHAAGDCCRILPERDARSELRASRGPTLGTDGTTYVPSPPGLFLAEVEHLSRHVLDFVTG